jgi:hypothetical protein
LRNANDRRPAAFDRQELRVLPFRDHALQNVEGLADALPDRVANAAAEDEQLRQRDLYGRRDGKEIVGDQLQRLERLGVFRPDPAQLEVRQAARFREAAERKAVLE